METCQWMRWRPALAAVLAATMVSAWCEEPLLITEFMAFNDSTLRDDTGEYSDWIELFNNGTNTVNLAGYFLTDDAGNLTKWTFPSTNLAAGRYLLVFASGQNHATAGAPLHTNFKLDAAGDYLSLVRPDGRTIVSQFGPLYPPQQRGVSFGLAVEDIDAHRLVAADAPAKVLVPTENIGTDWTKPGFDDSAWFNATTAIKFDRTTGALSYDNVSGTDIESLMSSKSSTVFIRIPFPRINTSNVTDFQLLMAYDDGFVAYLNGQEIARRLAPAAAQWNSAATGVRSNDVALISESINLIDQLSLLRADTNVLAIHGLNRTFSDPDFLIKPELIARNVNVLTNVARYFDTPTPGAANIAGLPGTAPAVRFSPATTTFISPFRLVLEPTEPVNGAVIRYTLDRSTPTESSPAYSGPLNVSGSVEVRARAFAPGLFPGPVRTEGYIALSANVVNVTSDLPILIIHSFGGGRVNGTTYNGAYMTIYEPVRGRSALTNAPHLATRAAFKDRGSSTAGQAKANYAVELWDEDNQARNLSLLGMPAESDWVFHAPYTYDRALIRNPLAFEMAHQLGRYSSRYRFVEVYVNAGTTTGPISSANYVGVYNVLEKIKRGPGRVAIDELRVSDTEPPEVTGGYIMKIDRFDPGDSGLNAGGRSLALVEPKEVELKSPERAAQKKYITDYLNAFNSALSSISFTNATKGYSPYIDTGAWIDDNIVEVLTWNVDAYAFSSYFHKPRNGPLTFGPVWDYDRALGSTDGRDANPRTWGNNFFTSTWWSRLFRDPDFWQKWIDRWEDVRQAQFSNRSFNRIIDSLAAQVEESAPRDFAKWRQAKRGGTQESEIQFTKNWLSNRLDFIDTNLLAKPIFSHAAGALATGLILSMAGPERATIYYTLDGTDPRLAGGALSSAARVYQGPIPLTATTIVTARCRDLAHRNLVGGNNPQLTSSWSGLTHARFSAFPPPQAGQLAVSEIMFNPPAPTSAELKADPTLARDDFEFIEIQNISAETLDLFGARFTSGIEFAFRDGPETSLTPGQTVLLVKNRTAFEVRYGSRPNIGGQFSGNLDNRGERLRMVNSAGAMVLDFEYSPDWYPVTDGFGFSLVASNNDLTSASASGRNYWRPSANSSGSPGQPDPAVASVPAVVVNEVLANTDRKDVVELHNPTAVPANIGGWFLSDDRKTPQKFRIPDGTVIAPGGYVTFDGDNFNSGKSTGARFSLSRFGEDIYLFAADRAGNLLGYSHGFTFGPSELGVTFGRYITSAGQEHFVAQTSPSLGISNAGPKIGPVVISEIMYHPPDVYQNGKYWDNDDDEFIELCNLTSQPVSLFNPARSTNVWVLRGAVDFAFPTNLTIPPQGYTLVVAFDPRNDPTRLDAFRKQYGVAPDTTVAGPFHGKMNNSTATIKLLMPGEPEPQASTEPAAVPFVLIDQVDYTDESPWPIGADGIGQSLQRLDLARYGNDPINWTASVPTPGSANKSGAAPIFTKLPLNQTVVAGSNVTFVAQTAGAAPVRFQWRFGGANLHGATNATLTLENVQPSNAGAYSVVAFNAGSSAASAPARLNVLPTPSIALQPLSRSTGPGSNVWFAVTATGTGRLTFQWHYNNDAIPGATNASLNLSNVQLADSGTYRVAVTDAIGTTFSEPAVLNVLLKPQIVEQPESVLAIEGDTVTLRVSATGTEPLSYRWRRDGLNLANATNALLTLANLQLDDTGAYSVAITNLPSARIATVSESALVVVLPAVYRSQLSNLRVLADGLSTVNAADAFQDIDVDGLTGWQEYLAGTDPQNAQSALKFDTIRIAPTVASLDFIARANRSYTVQFKSSLADPNWMTLTNFAARSTNRFETAIDAAPIGANRFYRLVTPALP